MGIKKVEIWKILKEVKDAEDNNKEKKLLDLFNSKLRDNFYTELKKMTRDERLALFVFLKICPELICVNDLWKVEYDKKIGRYPTKKTITHSDILKKMNDLGLVEKFEDDKNSETITCCHYSLYFKYMKKAILDFLGKCIYCKAEISPRACFCPKCGDKIF